MNSFCELCSRGGDDGIRTHDPLLAGQVLSQLSYTPILWGLLFSVLKEVRLESHRMCLCLCLAVSSAFSWTIRPLHFAVTVPLGYSARSTKARGRFVRLTAFIYSLTSLVGPSGLEPPTSCLSGTRSNLLSYEPMWLVSDFSSLGLFGLRKEVWPSSLSEVSALSYLPVQFPVKYFHHCRA